MAGTNERMKSRPGLSALLVACLIAELALVWVVGVSAAQRIRPPDGLKCPRNNLTSFTGTVLFYHRRLGRTDIRLRTDEDTTESVVVRHPGTEDPSKWFLLRAGPFKKENWGAIESARGHLHPKMRATVWVCDDGSNPIVDWQPPQ